MNTKEQLLNKLVLTYLKKNKDYGNSADRTHKIFGEQAYLIRLHDKVVRIERLLQSEAEVQESIEDTIIDLIVYNAMWLSTGCEPRIVGLAKEIHTFLNNPSHSLIHIIENMPAGFNVDGTTVEYIITYIESI